MGKIVLVGLVVVAAGLGIFFGFFNGSSKHAASVTHGAVVASVDTKDGPVDCWTKSDSQGSRHCADPSFVFNADRKVDCWSPVFAQAFAARHGLSVTRHGEGAVGSAVCGP